jgi:hypothetical protein
MIRKTIAVLLFVYAISLLAGNLANIKLAPSLAYAAGSILFDIMLLALAVFVWKTSTKKDDDE